MSKMHLSIDRLILSTITLCLDSDVKLLPERLSLSIAAQQTDVHVRYKEWDTLLSSGLWEPEAITEKLPEFLEFLKEAQAFLFHDKGK